MIKTRKQTHLPLTQLEKVQITQNVINWMGDIGAKTLDPNYDDGFVEFEKALAGVLDTLMLPEHCFSVLISYPPPGTFALVYSVKVTIGVAIKFDPMRNSWVRIAKQFELH